MKFLYYIFCFLLFFPGCSSSVKIRYFSIGEIFPTLKKSNATLSPCIAVENFQCPSFLKRQEILFREGKSQQIFLSSHELWWAMPEELATEALKDYLAKNKIFTHVFPYPTSHPIKYYLEGILKKFEMEVYEREWKACLALEIYLVERENNQILWHSGRLDIALSSMPDLQKAALKMGEAFEILFHKVAEEIQKYFSQKA